MLTLRSHNIRFAPVHILNKQFIFLSFLQDKSELLLNLGIFPKETLFPFRQLNSTLSLLLKADVYSILVSLAEI